MKKLFVLTMLALTVVAISADAQQSTQDQAKRRGPPKEAILACDGLQENAACSFAIEVEGACFAPPQGAIEGVSLACRPKEGIRGGRRGQGQRGQGNKGQGNRGQGNRGQGQGPRQSR